jgi:SAM-dependent methyltransferase
VAVLDDHPIHAALVRRLAGMPGALVLDLGAGRGATVEAAVRAYPDMSVLAIDRRRPALVHGRERVAGNGHVSAVIADLNASLPVGSATADAAVCHNVFESLDHPVEALREVRRVLKQDGRLLLSHTDFAGMVINAIRPDLNRTVIEAHAFATPGWMSVSDGYAPRKLAGYARAAGFDVCAVEPVVVLDTDFVEGRFAHHRISSMIEVIRGSGRAGGVTLDDEALALWMEDLRTLADRGAFFFSETAFVFDLVPTTRQSGRQPNRRETNRR